MDRRLATSHRLAPVAALVLTAAVLARVVTLPLPPEARAGEGLIAVAILGCLTAAHRLPRRYRRRALVPVIFVIAAALLASLGLRLASAQLPDYTMVATLVFAALLLGVDLSASATAVVLASGSVLIVFVELWLDTINSDVTELSSLLLAFVLLLAMHAVIVSHAYRAARGDATRSSAAIVASMARRLGVGSGIEATARAALEVCREQFPQMTFGAVLLDNDAGSLASPGIVLSSRGVVRGGPQMTLPRDRGFATEVIAGEEPCVWETAFDVGAVQSAVSDADSLKQLRLGIIRSAAAAPLTTVRGAVFGIVLLLSDRHEHAWTRADIPVLDVIANEAARNLERARVIERSAGQQGTDPQTGLLSVPRWHETLEREIARARRRSQTVSVLCAGLDGLDAVHEQWGAAEATRVMQEYAELLQTTLRVEDAAARDDDVFLCVLPGADREHAEAAGERIAERFSARMEEDRVRGPHGPRALSGCAVFPFDGERAGELVDIARTELARSRSTRPYTQFYTPEDENPEEDSLDLPSLELDESVSNS